jgi:hypothetical protein
VEGEVGVIHKYHAPFVLTGYLQKLKGVKATGGVLTFKQHHLNPFLQGFLQVFGDQPHLFEQLFL